MNSNKNTYQFTQDWFSHNIKVFEIYLEHYKNKKCNFLEIGTFEGRSAIWMLENILTNPDSKLTCVDPGYPEYIDRLKSNLSYFNNVKLIQKPNIKAFNDYWKETFDFIYVDGSHSAVNCLWDMRYSWDVLKHDGIMAIDDYEWKLKDPDGTCPAEAVDLFMKSNDDYILLHKGYQVWLQKK